MKKLKKWMLPAGMTLAGAVIGWLWSVNRVCIGGNCIILGTPVLAAFYVGAIGFLLSMLIPKKKEP